MATGEINRRDHKSVIQSPAILDKLKAVLPSHLRPEKQIQVALTAIFRTPKLQECDPLSVANAMIQASELGLDLTPALGEAYLVPRWNSKARVSECTFQPGYRGLVKLARQSGDVLDIQADTVCEADQFAHGRNPRPYLMHEPAMRDRGKVVAAYAVAYLRSGIDSHAVMTVEEIEAIRKRSKSGSNGPWVTDWDEMAKKTVFRRASKWVPISSEQVAMALEVDDRDVVDGRVTASTSRIDTSIMAAISAKPLEAPPEPENEPHDYTADLESSVTFSDLTALRATIDLDDTIPAEERGQLLLEIDDRLAVMGEEAGGGR
jgi:recombination protein RecT